MPIESFSVRIIDPRDYDLYDSPAVRRAKKDESVAAASATFRYKDQPAILWFTLSRLLLKDAKFDIEEVLKENCLNWARRNWPTGGGRDGKEPGK